MIKERMLWQWQRSRGILMTNPIKGLVAVTSDYGIGKTTFALECGYHPKDMIFINDNVKETGFDTEFSQYVDLVNVSSKMTMLEFHNQCIEMISKLKKNKVIIWDTWARFASTFYSYVVANPDKFRTKKQYAGTSAIVAGRMYQDAYRYEGAVVSALKKKCDLLILTFHLKSLFVNGIVVPDRFKPDHDKAIENYADLRLWLTPNPNSQVPIGLVMKNISKRAMEKGVGIRTKQVLPLRLNQCNWDSILHYWENPIGDRMPEDHEKPSAFELSLIGGTLTPENRRMYQAGIELAKIQNEAENKEQITAIKEFLADLKDAALPTKMMLVKKIIKAGDLSYDGEITIDKISKWSK